MISKLTELLHAGGYTLIVGNRGTIRTFSGRGISDLYELLSGPPAFLNGAVVADKVTGKGAAALMILGGVRELYTDLISEPALMLLQMGRVKVKYKAKVPQIWNRTRSGLCPVETLCQDAVTAEACLPLIEEFMNSIRKSI